MPVILSEVRRSRTKSKDPISDWGSIDAGQFSTTTQGSIACSNHTLNPSRTRAHPFVLYLVFY